jgi:hypothetical protein
VNLFPSFNYKSCLFRTHFDEEAILFELLFMVITNFIKFQKFVHQELVIESVVDVIMVHLCQLDVGVDVDVNVGEDEDVAFRMGA